MITPTWHYSDGKQTYGPIHRDQLIAMIQSGQMRPEHCILPQGTEEWQVVRSSPFAGYLPTAPVASSVLPQQPQKPAMAPPKRVAGQPTAKKAPIPQPPAAQTSLTSWLIKAAVLLAVVGLGWWLTQPKTIPTRKTVQRIEGEAIKVLKFTGGEVEPQPMKQSNALWSGDAHLWWHGGSPKYVLDLEFTVEPEQVGRQRLKAAFTSSYDYGIVEVSVDGLKLKNPILDLQANVAVISGARDLGLLDLSAGPHVLSISLRGTSVINRGEGEVYGMGLDYIQLEPPVLPTVPVAAGTNIAIKAQPSASFCERTDHVLTMKTGEEYPGRKSEDQSLPRFTWHPHKGIAEWAQYEWESPQVIGECRVFWFDDSTVRGGCALPAFWRLLYREEATGAWVPVQTGIPAAERDTWNVVKFPAVRTTALRIAVQCLEGYSAGICHWQALTADLTSVPDTKTKGHPDLFFGDLSPLRAQVGWGSYRGNLSDSIATSEGRGVLHGGKPCSQYLWAHANSRIDFAIPEGYTRFTAYAIGPSDLATGAPTAGADSWKASVLVDSRQLADSNPLSTYKGHEFLVDIAFPAGSKVLTLITDTLGNGTFDNAFWAFPTLLTAESQKLPATATVTAHAPAHLFPPKRLPEGAIRTSTLSKVPVPSKRAGQKFGLHFINIMAEPVKLYLITGDKQLDYGGLAPGGERVMNTYEGHNWLLTNAADVPIACVQGSPAQPVVVIDGLGHGAGPSASESTTPSLPQKPTSNTELRPSREDGDPSHIRFINKLKDELKIQLADNRGKLTKWWTLRAGRTIGYRTSIGEVWVITTKSGTRLGLVESLTERSTAEIDASGVQVTADEVPTRESQQLVSMIQFTETNIGDALTLLRQRVAEARLNVQIELDPQVDPKAGSTTLDALTLPLDHILDICASNAGARYQKSGSTYRIVRR